MSINILNYALAKKDWDRAYENLTQLKVGGRNLILSSHVVEAQSITVAEIINIDSKKAVLSMWDDAHKNAITEIGFMIVFKDLSYRIDSISAGDLPYFINEEDEIVDIVFYFYGIDKEQFFESKFKFEKGNKATDWTPAPEDLKAHPFVVELAELSYKVDNQLLN